MAGNYYTLVAGLREYSLDAENKGFDAREIIDDIRSQLSGGDRERLVLFYNYYDIQNILSIMAGRSQFSDLGNYSREELEDSLKSPAAIQESELPDYIKEVLIAYANPEDTDYDKVNTEQRLEKSLFEAYYNKCAGSSCRFIRQWSEFDRNLRNVAAAFTARRMGLPVAETLVGDGYVADMLGKSSAADFGLKGEIDYMDEIMAAIGDEANLLQKEHRIDLIRWDVSDTLTTFDYFNIDYILGYLVKVNLIHRWSSLDPAVGREMFRRLLESVGEKELIERAGQEKEK